jgi:hypothetical protein
MMKLLGKIQLRAAATPYLADRTLIRLGIGSLAWIMDHREAIALAVELADAVEAAKASLDPTEAAQ